MPECYTHAYIAGQALVRCGQVVASQTAYLAGANGPDPFFMYQFFKRNPEPDLPKLANRIQRDNPGEFLNILLQYATTPVQQSYVMGFLTHYATACTLNPYIAAMGPAGLYVNRKGRCRLEASFDSALYYKDYKTYLVPVFAGTPVIVAEELAQVTSLLHEAITLVYQTDVPTVALADVFHSNLRMRKFMHSQVGIKKVIAKLFVPLFAGRKKGGLLFYRMQPAKPLPKMPDKWKNPYTGEEMTLTFDEIIALAEQTSAALIVAAMRYWLGEIDEDQVAGILGNNNFYTGLPNPSPRQEQQ